MKIARRSIEVAISVAYIKGKTKVDTGRSRFGFPKTAKQEGHAGEITAHFN